MKEPFSNTVSTIDTWDEEQRVNYVVYVYRRERKTESDRNIEKKGEEERNRDRDVVGSFSRPCGQDESLLPSPTATQTQ